MHRNRHRALIPLLIVVFVGGLAAGYAAGRQVTQWIIGTPCGQGAPAGQQGLLAADRGGRWQLANTPPLPECATDASARLWYRRPIEWERGATRRARAPLPGQSPNSLALR